MKTLNFSTQLRDFDGSELKVDDGDKKDALFTLKLAVIALIRNAHASEHLSDADQSRLYALGCRVGLSDGKPIDLPQEEYDVLKRLCDKPPRMSIVITQQVKKLVDAATETPNPT